MKTGSYVVIATVAALIAIGIFIFGDVSGGDVSGKNWIYMACISLSISTLVAGVFGIVHLYITENMVSSIVDHKTGSDTEVIVRAISDAMNQEKRVHLDMRPETDGHVGIIEELVKQIKGKEYEDIKLYIHNGDRFLDAYNTAGRPNVKCGRFEVLIHDQKAKKEQTDDKLSTISRWQDFIKRNENIKSFEVRKENTDARSFFGIVMTRNDGFGHGLIGFYKANRTTEDVDALMACGAYETGEIKKSMLKVVVDYFDHNFKKDKSSDFLGDPRPEKSGS